MNEELYTKLLSSVTEFTYFTVSTVHEKDGKVTLHIPNMGLWASVQKSHIESKLSNYIGKKVKIFNSLKNFNIEIDESR
jgi:alpha-amylase/alpha-mannosidase (GH57 family)